MNNHEHQREQRKKTLEKRKQEKRRTKKRSWKKECQMKIKEESEDGMREHLEGEKESKGKRRSGSLTVQ
jgi:hypothetical protein